MDDDATVLEEEVEESKPVETEEVEAVEVEDAEADGGSEEEIEEEAVPEREFSFGGTKFSVPEGSIPNDIADELDKFSKGIWSDYSRKGQELAEKSASVEAREGAVQKMQELQGEGLEAFSRGLMLRQELDQLEATDINRLWQENPDEARRVSDMISAKSAEFQRTVQEVGRIEAAQAQAQEAETSRRMAEGKAIVEKALQGFEGTQKERDTIQYAVNEFGVPEASARQWALNPTSAIMAYKAMMYDRSQAKAVQAAKPKPAPAEPVTRQRGTGGARRTSVEPRDTDSVDEWMRKRNQQLRRKAGV